MKTKLLKLIWPLLAALILTGTAHATVSVDEIIRLHQRGLSVQSLLLVIEASDTPDTISTAQLNDMLDADLPDTVITLLVAYADAVAEDWTPVNIDEEVEDYKVVTETRYVYVDDSPDWSLSVGFAWGHPHYYSYWYRPLYVDYVWDPFWDPWDWGWCGTPYYYYHYRPWHYGSNIYVNIGWYGGHYGYYGYGGHHGYAYHDYWYNHHDHGTYYAYQRNIDRPHYRNSVYRRAVERGGNKNYRSTSDNRGQLTGPQDTNRRRTEIDRVKRADDGKRIRTGDNTRIRDTQDDRGRKALTDNQRLDPRDIKTPKRTDKSDADRSLRTKQDTKRDIFARDPVKNETREQKLDRYKKSTASKRSIYSRDQRTNPTELRNNTTTRRRVDNPRRVAPADRKQPGASIDRGNSAPKPRPQSTPPRVKPAPEKKDGDKKVAPPKKSGRSPDSRQARPAAPPRRAPEATRSKGDSKSSESGKSRKPR